VQLTYFVDGKPAEADPSGPGLDLVAPQTGQSIGRIAESGKSGMDRAVAAASTAFVANRKQPTHQRMPWLNAAADAVKVPPTKSQA
jgi:aminomuconate-semialdehyde/2-hydroxymuconate-6-semialdehyde dehydrogenase